MHTPTSDGHTFTQSVSPSFGTTAFFSGSGDLNDTSNFGVTADFRSNKPVGDDANSPLLDGDPASRTGGDNAERKRSNENFVSTVVTLLKKRYNSNDMEI